MRVFLSFFICVCICGCATFGGGRKHEKDLPVSFRGAWIPTVNNIDWPSEPGLPVEEQKAELRALLDTAKRANLNVVILQVRTAGDALYESELEPWSEYLTGEMGRAPEPYYDPLEFAVEEAHKRGLELHAWFNPYRARYRVTVSELSPEHIAARRPDLVRTYGQHLWMDPGEPEVQDLTVAVIMDVIRRYEIDGVHFDDYFYPYPETDESGEDIEFDDDASWQRYVDAGGTMERDDWRRQNVNTLVERLHREIKAYDKDVMFGISPFGIWRPGNPEGIEGFDQFARMYADPLLWLKEGWVDYLAPQLYWPSYQTAQNYPALLDWWTEQAEGEDVLLLSGMATYRVVDEPHLWGNDEYLHQVELNRELGADGEIHYYLGILRDHPDLLESLKSRFYQRKAIVPEE